MRYLVPALLLTLVAGCVTEGPARPLPEPELDRAAELNVRLGYEYLRTGKRAEAALKFERALEQDDDNADAHLGLAFVHDQAGDLVAARKHYQNALSHSEDAPPTLNAWGEFLCRQGEHAEADRAYVQAARNVGYRTPELAWTNAARCARKAGDPAKAEGYLREALRANPRFADALLQFADLSLERKEPLRTRAFIERYLELGAPSAGALLLGWRAEQALGDKRAAQRYAERLQRDFPASPEARQVGGGR